MISQGTGCTWFCKYFLQDECCKIITGQLQYDYVFTSLYNLHCILSSENGLIELFERLDIKQHLKNFIQHVSMHDYSVPSMNRWYAVLLESSVWSSSPFHPSPSYDLFMMPVFFLNAWQGFNQLRDLALLTERDVAKVWCRDQGFSVTLSSCACGFNTFSCH